MRPRWWAEGEDLLVPATDVAAAAASGVVPLEAEAGQRHPPAVADAAEAKVVGEPDVGEEHLVEAAPPLICRIGPDVDARARPTARGTRSSPLCLGTSGSVRVMARPQSANRAPGRPHLLPVEHPLVAVAHRPGRRQPARSDPGRRLAEQLAAELVHAHQRPHEALGLLGRAARGDGGRDQAHRRRRQLAGQGDGEAPLLAVVGPQVARRQPPTAERLRPVDHGVARVELEPLPRPGGLEASARSSSSLRSRKTATESEPSPHCASKGLPSSDADSGSGSADASSQIARLLLEAIEIGQELVHRATLLPACSRRRSVEVGTRAGSRRPGARSRAATVRPTRRSANGVPTRGVVVLCRFSTSAR